MFVASTKSRCSKGALQEGQCDAQAAEEGKEQSISVMHLSARAGEQGNRGSTVQQLSLCQGPCLQREDRTRSGTVN